MRAASDERFDKNTPIALYGGHLVYFSSLCHTPVATLTRLVSWIEKVPARLWV
jgi:hypothetical protein